MGVVEEIVEFILHVLDFHEERVPQSLGGGIGAARALLKLVRDGIEP